MARPNICTSEISVQQFRLSYLRHDHRRSDQALYTTAVLDNCEGRFRGMLWPESGLDISGLMPGSVVQAAGTHRFLGEHVVIDLQSIEVLPQDLVANGAALLPRHKCPRHAHAALDRLVALNERLDPPVLREFLTRILLDERIGLPLLRCRAAHDYHHAYAGGLLVHSTEMLDVVEVLARKGLPHQSNAVGLLQLGYLLHDIGKIDTIGSTGWPVLGQLVRHETRTFVLMAPHLRWLEERWPDGAGAVSFILDFCATPAAKRGIARWLGADIVIWADQLSTAASRGGGNKPLRISDAPAPPECDWENINEF